MKIETLTRIAVALGYETQFSHLSQRGEPDIPLLYVAKCSTWHLYKPELPEKMLEIIEHFKIDVWHEHDEGCPWCAEDGDGNLGCGRNVTEAVLKVAIGIVGGDK